MSAQRRTDAQVSLSQRELDTLKVLAAVRHGQRSQVEAARLLGISARHVRRLLRKLQEGGDAALAHGLRGQPSKEGGRFLMPISVACSARPNRPYFAMRVREMCVCSSPFARVMTSVR
jgi:hypothetical protein